MAITYSFVNGKGKYAIIDERGKIIERFRLITTAMNALKKLKRDYSSSKLQIIKVGEKTDDKEI